MNESLGTPYADGAVYTYSMALRRAVYGHIAPVDVPVVLRFIGPKILYFNNHLSSSFRTWKWWKHVPSKRLEHYTHMEHRSNQDQHLQHVKSVLRVNGYSFQDIKEKQRPNAPKKKVT